MEWFAHSSSLGNQPASLGWHSRLSYNLMKIDVWFWPIPLSIQSFIGNSSLPCWSLNLPWHYSTTWVTLPFPVYKNLSILQSKDLLNWLYTQGLIHSKDPVFVKGANRSITESELVILFLEFSLVRDTLCLEYYGVQSKKSQS